MFHVEHLRGGKRCWIGGLTMFLVGSLRKKPVYPRSISRKVFHVEPGSLKLKLKSAMHSAKKDLPFGIQ